MLFRGERYAKFSSPVKVQSPDVSAEPQHVFSGACTTRDTVRAEVGDNVPLGSIYLSSAGKIYLKVAAAGATTDWQKVTATAAD